MVIREPPLEDYRPRICMKRTARVGTVYMGSWRSQDSMQESLALESEEDFSSCDESGEDSEEERLYFEKRIDPKEDFCSRKWKDKYGFKWRLSVPQCESLIAQIEKKAKGKSKRLVKEGYDAAKEWLEEAKKRAEGIKRAKDLRKADVLALTDKEDENAV
ncbi:hypothetical protein MHYP_G00088760 [Metynnis hypsauchen]